MSKIATLVFCLSTLFGCATRVYPDLSHYTLEDFKNEPARCNSKAKCKYIGYGIGNGGCTSSPIFEGFIVYSSKIGNTNIEHLKVLAKESRRPFSQKPNSPNLPMSVEYEEYEVCLPVDHPRPILQCISNVCINIAGVET